MFDDEDETRIHTRVQAGGGGAAGEQWSAADADRGRTRDPAVDAAELACCPEWRRTAILDAIASGNVLGTPVASPADQAAEIARLRRELERTRMERDVLKKAIGIFAEMPK